MIDINKMRRLAQAATPGPWKACRNHECYEGAYFEIDPEDEAEYAAKPFTHIEARTEVVTAAHDRFEFHREDAEFIAAANPAAVSEILDRLEAAEKECDELRAKIAAMERQAEMTHNEYPTRLDICDGKYTLIIDMDTGRAECLRYGEKWRDLVGDKMVLALFDELVEARARAEAAKAETEDLRAKIAKVDRQEPLDAGSDVFRGAFEAALKAGNWPATRQGDGYRSPSTQIAWRIAFSTVNRLKLYLAPGAKGEEK